LVGGQEGFEVPKNTIERLYGLKQNVEKDMIER